jgi:hypothetical protein
MKIKLVTFAEDIYTHISIPRFTQVLKENFDVETFDAEKTYNNNSTVICLSLHHYDNNKVAIDNLIDLGFKIVIERLHEAGFGFGYTFTNNVLTIASGLTGSMNVHVPMFFWYNLYKPYVSSIENKNYKKLIRKNNFDKKFLMLMRNFSPVRDQVYAKFHDILDDGYYSYYYRGMRIFGDKEPNVNITLAGWDNYINVEWYNRTQFSVVVETHTVTNNNNIFLTEKTMKPLALKHPFITLGNTGSLALLKSAGFETFENIFDESYDSMPNYVDKIDNIYDQVKNYNHSGYSKLTQDKIEHNYNLFHNDAEVACRFKRDVIDPILEFANATP